MTSVRVHAALNKLTIGEWTPFQITRTHADWLDNRAYQLSEPVNVWVKLNRQLELLHPIDIKTVQDSRTKDLTTLPYDRALSNQALRNQPTTWFEPDTWNQQATCETPAPAAAQILCAKRTCSNQHDLAPALKRQHSLTGSQHSRKEEKKEQFLVCESQLSTEP